MKKLLMLIFALCTGMLVKGSVSFILNFRIPDNVKDVRYLYFELSNNGDTLFTELNDKCTPGYVFTETAESRVRKGTMEMRIRYSKNGKKWKEEKLKVDITAHETELHFYYQFALDEDGHGYLSGRTVYRIEKGTGKNILFWKKNEVGNDSAVFFHNPLDSTQYIIGKSDVLYGEMYRRNEANLFTVEWKGVNTDNPCKDQAALYELKADTSIRVFFPNLECNELKIKTAGKYQVRIYASSSPVPVCNNQEGVQVCILNARSYFMEFDRK